VAAEVSAAHPLHLYHCPILGHPLVDFLLVLLQFVVLVDLCEVAVEAAAWEGRVVVVLAGDVDLLAEAVHELAYYPPCHHLQIYFQGLARLLLLLKAFS
jgi:hypothetical protein